MSTEDGDALTELLIPLCLLRNLVDAEIIVEGWNGKSSILAAVSPTLGIFCPDLEDGLLSAIRR